MTHKTLTVMRDNVLEQMIKGISKFFNERVGVTYNNPGRFVVKLGNDAVDVRESFMLLSSLNLSFDKKDLATKLTLRDIDIARKKISTGTPNRIKGVQDDSTYKIIESSIMPIPAYASFQAFRDAFYSNMEAGISILANGTYIAIFLLTGKFARVPNVLNAHALLVGYWLSQNGLLQPAANVLFSRFRNNTFKSLTSAGVDPNTEDSAEVFIKKFFNKNKGDDELIYSYLVDSYKTSIVCAYYKHIDEFVSHIRDLLKTEMGLQEVVDSLKTRIIKFEEDDKLSQIYASLHKQRINIYVIVCLSLVSLHNAITNFGTNILYIALCYEYISIQRKLSQFELKSNEDTAKVKGVSSERVQFIEYMLKNNSYTVTFSVHYFIDDVIRNKLEQLLRTTSASDRSIAFEQDQRKKAEDKLKQVKDNLKAKITELKTAQDRIAYLESEVERLTRRSADIDGISIDSFNALQKEIVKLRESLDLEIQSSQRLQSELRKSEKKVAELEGKLKESTESYGKLDAKYNREKNLSSQLAVSREYKKIPLEAFINAIRTKKVYIVGGYSIRREINQYGLSNIKIAQANVMNISLGELSDMDLVVGYTAQARHSPVMNTRSICARNNIPFIFFSETSFELLIYRIFSALYENKN